METRTNERKEMTTIRGTKFRISAKPSEYGPEYNWEISVVINGKEIVDNMLCGLVQRHSKAPAIGFYAQGTDFFLEIDKKTKEEYEIFRGKINVDIAERKANWAKINLGSCAYSDYFSHSWSGDLRKGRKIIIEEIQKIISCCTKPEMCEKVATREYDDYISELRKVEEKKIQKKIREEKVFAEAKRTGQPIMLRSFSTECNDPEEECGVDNITVYANPDGTTTQERVHTY